MQLNVIEYRSVLLIEVAEDYLYTDVIAGSNCCSGKELPARGQRIEIGLYGLISAVALYKPDRYRKISCGVIVFIYRSDGSCLCPCAVSIAVSKIS